MAGDYFGFDQRSQRFRDLSSGRFVSERAVRDGVDRVADLTSRRLGELTARFRAGEISAVQWQTEMLAQIKQAHIASALAAYGGRDAMTPEKWGYVGWRVREQFAYARRMAEDILSGRQRMNGRLDARARMYGSAVRQTYNSVRARESRAAGLKYERNVLGVAEHCPECRAQTARGVVPIGTLIPPGYRQCRASCRCSLVYMNQPDEARGAA